MVLFHVPGVAYKGELVVGLILDPFRDECFTATLGGGAFCNGKPIKVCFPLSYDLMQCLIQVNCACFYELFCLENSGTSDCRYEYGIPYCSGLASVFLSS